MEKPEELKKPEQLIEESLSIWRQSLDGLDMDLDIAKSPLGPTSFMPGDIAEFSYSMTYKRYTVNVPVRRYLIVSTKKGPNGSFTARTTGNQLLCCFQINENVANIQKLITILYKRRDRCSYYMTPTLLKLVFESKLFKTFNYVGLKEISELYLKNKEPEEVEESKDSKDLNSNLDTEI